MNRTDILNMPAGREMDLEVGYRLFGYNSYLFIDGGDGIKPFHPSTDIAAAWEVVEKIRQSGMLLYIRVHPNKYFVTIRSEKGGDYTIVGEGSNASAPLAICRAAILASMEAVP